MTAGHSVADLCRAFLGTGNRAPGTRQSDRAITSVWSSFCGAPAVN